MGIIDDVVSGAKSVAANVGKKAELIVDLSKLKISSAELQSDISKKYQTLGKIVYDASKDETLAGGIDGIIEEIDGLYEALQIVENEISALCNKKVCPNCKKANDAKFKYCSACGALLPETEKAEECENACECGETCEEPCGCKCDEACGEKTEE